MKHLYSISGIALFLMSCSNQELLSPELRNESVVSPISISEYSSAVTKNDAKKLSNTFWFRSSIQRRNIDQTKIIKNIETINNDNGTPMAYIINYQHNRGFIIVSATREYHPILAYSDTGMYHLDSGSEATKKCLHNHIGIIDNIDSLSIEDRQLCMAEWSNYESSESERSMILATNNLKSEYDKFRRDAMHNWKSEGKEFTFLKNSNIPYLPESIRKEYLNTAKANFLNDANQEDYAMVVWETTRKVSENKTSITSQWGQQRSFCMPYENISYPPTGCVPLAMGMVMRYFNWPVTYNWNGMSDLEGTDESRKLLRDIGILAKTKYGYSNSSTNTSEAKEAFSEMGFSYVYEKKHDFTKNSASIDANSPIVMIGTGSTGDRHAWVCDGYKKESSYINFVFYVLKHNNELLYEPIGDFERNGAAGNWEHMNWGYYGEGNGWFLESCTQIVIGNQTLLFDQERAEFRNIKPMR